MFVVLVMVLKSHHHATYAEQQLLRYREMESALLLQLHKIERHSVKLHKNIRTRLQRAGVEVDSADSLDDSEINAMSQELHGQVRSLQEAIQEEARANIVNEYGEGPVKLALDLQIAAEPGNNSLNKSTESRVDILLWPDTPHAAWTLLEQVGRHVWDGAQFHWNPDLPILEITPTRTDPLNRGKLEFAEYIPEHTGWHSSWTVGLREDPETGKLQLFLNLKDNAEYQGHEACVGRVLGGFDSLQRVLNTIRETNGDVPAVIIRQASAMHATMRELGFK